MLNWNLRLRGARLCWNGVGLEPRMQRVLWCQGHLANRSSLTAELGQSPTAPNKDILIGLYRLFGISETARRLKGSLSWVLWDGPAGKLLAVRDRLGEHELFYRSQRDGFLLASRVEDLFAAPGGGKARLDPLALAGHLHAIPSLPGRSFFQTVETVAPGEILTVEPESIRRESYWQPELQPTLKLANDREYANAFHEVFFRVVEEYRASGENGLTLSGGLDSPSIAYVLRTKSQAGRLVALRWISPTIPEADEDPYSRNIVAALDLEDQPIRADRHLPFSSSLDRYLEPGTPFAGYYFELWEATIRRAREAGLRTVLTGLSGDHLMSGTVFSYPDLLLTGRWSRLVRELRQQKNQTDLSLSHILRWQLLEPLVRMFYPRARRWIEPVPWLGEALRSPYEERREPLPLPWAMPGRRDRLAELRDPVLTGVTSYFTKIAARQGVELRHPWLDDRLIDFAASLPSDQTFQAGIRKGIVRRAMRGRLPSSVVDLPHKIYPTQWFLTGARTHGAEQIRELSTNMRAAELGFVDEPRFAAHCEDFLQGRSDETLFWYTLTLEAWLRKYGY